MKTFDQEKKALTDKADCRSAEAEHKKVIGTTRADAAALKRQNWIRVPKENEETLNDEIVQKTRNEVFAITRKALTDLASVSLEGQSVEAFVKRLNELSEEEKQKFVEAFQSNSNAVIVRSAFDLPEKQQAEIKDAVNKILKTTPSFQFKTTPELISGIELTSNGYKLAWSVSEYLTSLEKSMPITKKETPEAVPEKK